jgi:predicted TIM-barrel fold metal-dependent hydrolase
MIVDAHQIFWDSARVDYGWLKPDNPIHRIYSTDWPVLTLAGD